MRAKPHCLLRAGDLSPGPDTGTIESGAHGSEPAMGARFYGPAPSQIQPAWSLVHWMYHDVAIFFVQRLLFPCNMSRSLSIFFNFRLPILENLLAPTKLRYKLTPTVHEEVMFRKFTGSSLSCVTYSLWALSWYHSVPFRIWHCFLPWCSDKGTN